MCILLNRDINVPRERRDRQQPQQGICVSLLTMIGAMLIAAMVNRVPLGLRLKQSFNDASR
jgi:hypothetical protein